MIKSDIPSFPTRKYRDPTFLFFIAWMHEIFWQQGMNIVPLPKAKQRQREYHEFLLLISLNRAFLCLSDTALQLSFSKVGMTKRV